MTIVLKILMIIVAAGIATYPFFEKITKVKRIKIKEKPLDFTQQKEIVMTNLGEIEFDHKMNKLTDEDYQELKALYKEKARKLLAKNDELLGINKQDIVDSLEAELKEELDAVKKEHK